jgi:hypothetical protein
MVGWWESSPVWQFLLGPPQDFFVFFNAHERQVRADRMASLNPTIEPTISTNIFLPWDFIVHNEFPIIVGFAIVLAIVYTVAYYVCLDLIFGAKNQPSMTTKRKVCYQITNFVCNSILSVMGLYLQYVVIPRQEHNVVETVTGYVNEVLWISLLQLGYQLWSIPMGMFLVPESTMMLLHHVCVICCCSMTAFMRTGFRYYTPFFYGIFEVSSLPLAIFNTMRDNPAYVKENPTIYLATRTIFACCFLFVRVYMVIPRKARYLFDHYNLWTARATAALSPALLQRHYCFRCYMGFVWCCSLFLMLLQFYWAVLIVKGILKQFVYPYLGKRKQSASAVPPNDLSAYANGSNGDSHHRHTNGYSKKSD